MLQGMAAVCLIPYGWGSFPQQAIPAGLCLWSTEHYRELGTPEHSSSWQQHSRDLTFVVPFLWISTQITVPLEGMQICVNLNYSQTCGCWKNGKTQSDNEVSKHAAGKARRNTPTVSPKLPTPIFMVWFIYLLKYCRNPGLVTQFSSGVYVKLSHPKWSFKPRVTDKKRDEIKCSCCSRHKKDC